MSETDKAAGQKPATRDYIKEGEEGFKEGWEKAEARAKEAQPAPRKPETKPNQADGRLLQAPRL